MLARAASNDMHCIQTQQLFSAPSTAQHADKLWVMRTVLNYTAGALYYAWYPVLHCSLSMTLPQPTTSQTNLLLQCMNVLHC
jgi:hypothetical protein